MSKRSDYNFNKRIIVYWYNILEDETLVTLTKVD